MSTCVFLDQLDSQFVFGFQEIDHFFKASFVGARYFARIFLPRKEGSSWNLYV